MVCHNPTLISSHLSSSAYYNQINVNQTFWILSALIIYKDGQFQWESNLCSNYAYRLVNILENRRKVVEMVLEIGIRYEWFGW